MLIRLSALFFSTLFFLPTLSSAFLDVENAALDRLVERNILEDGKEFFPDEMCRRADFAEWALKNVGEDVTEETIQSPYVDAKNMPFVGRLWELGLTEDSVLFSPEKPTTKMDAIKILLPLEGVSIPRAGFTLHEYNDLPEDAYERSLIAKSLRMRLVNDTNYSSFGGDTELTRLECAKLVDAIALHRISEQLIYQKEIQKGDKPKQQAFNTIWRILHTKFLNFDDISDEELMESAIREMVRSLDDPYTTYFNEEEVTSFLTTVGIGGEFGIGAQVGINEKGQVLIMRPLRESPAEKAGVRAGDVVIAVDGVDVSDGTKPLEEVVSLIKGQKGESVTIEFLRGSKKITITIRRGAIQPKSLFAKVLDGYLLIELDFFGEDSIPLFQKAIEQYPKAAEKGIILDLRDNPGGFLQTATALLEYFVPEGTMLVQTKGRDLLHQTKSHEPGELSEVPLVVLVNERSASASEIVAGAVKDLNRAALVGQKTFGKGTVQELLQFADGSALKVTVAEWLTPNGDNIHKVGIDPTYFLEDDVENPLEMQEKAVRILQRGQWKTGVVEKKKTTTEIPRNILRRAFEQ